MYFIPIFSILPNPDYIHLKDPDSPHATFSLCAMKIARSTQLGTYNLPPLIILWWQHMVFTPSKSHITFSLKLFRNKKQKRRKQKPNRGEKRSQRTCKTVYTDLFRATHKKEKRRKKKGKRASRNVMFVFLNTNIKRFPSGPSIWSFLNASRVFL